MSWWSLPICGTNETPISECKFIPFSNPIFSLTFLGITLCSLILADLVFRKISYSFDIEITASKSIPNDVINYVFPYVVSFMGISYNEPEKLLGFAVFLLWMFSITYKSGQIIMNPLLLMFGWRLYEATISINGATREVRIMKQGAVVPGIQKAQTIQDFYIVRD